MSDPINKKQFKVLKFLVDLFNKLKIKYFIDDGLATIIYGSKRKLYDIDICITSESMNKLKIVFNDLAFKPFSYKKFADCHVHLVTFRINNIPIDARTDKREYVCHTGKGKKRCVKLHDEFRNTKIVKFRGLRLRVINPELLFVTKLFINRKCDRTDAKAILKHRRMNKNKIIRLSKKFEIEDKVLKLLI